MEDKYAYDSVKKDLEALGFTRKDFFGWEDNHSDFYRLSDKNLELVLSVTFEISPNNEEYGLITLQYKDKGFGRIEEYFKDFLHPTPEELELFKMEFGVEYPIKEIIG